MNSDPGQIELTILMPCLNEAETLQTCIEKAQKAGAHLRLNLEVVVADNGSTDASVEIAERSGARVVHAREKGYGSALGGGIRAARGKWIIMGDADDSYDFSQIAPFVEKLRQGFELVIGCRMPRGGGVIAPGAMRWKHRWLGNPVLSLIGRTFFRCPINDFHCGLRAFTKQAFEKMELQTTGMEFASEMVIKATMKDLKIGEVPITLHKDGRSRPSHLRSWRDGWRHLRFMLLFSPRWLFLIPGLVLATTGLVGMLLLSYSQFGLGGLTLDAGTMAVTSAAVLVGFQLIAFAAFTKVFAIAEGLLPNDPSLAKLFRFVNLERGVMAGILMLLIGGFLLIRALLIWKGAGFGEISYSENLRRVIPATTLIAVGMQVIFSSFFLSVLGLKTGHRTPPSTELR
jgi:glycosyltransferase involved in cell wall biosynthesis